MFDAALLIFQLVAGLVGIAIGPTSGPPYEGPGEALTVHEVRTATDEEIAAAGAEVPELLRRAQEAAGRARQ